MVVDRQGGIWFTDLGKRRARDLDYGGVYYAAADGSAITEAVHPFLTANGIGLSPDEKHLYVADTFQARVYRYDARLEEQEPQYVATAMGDVAFDSLAVTASGNICVATVLGGGVSTVTPDGKVTMLDVPQDSLVTNIAFGGEDMRDAYLTFSGPGQLVHMRWEEPGLKLAFNA